MSPWFHLLPFGALLIILPFPGTVAMRLLLLTAAVLVAAFTLWRRPSSPPPALPCAGGLAFWILVSTLSIAYAADPAYSIGEMKSEIGYTMLAFFSFLVVTKDRQIAERLILCLAAGFTVIGVLAGGAWLTHGLVWIETGRHGGIGVFATLVVTVIPLFVWLALEGSKPWHRRAAIVLLVFAILLGLLTGQRAVWPALILQFLLALILLTISGRLKLTWRRVLLIGLLILTLGGAAFVAVSTIKANTAGVPDHLATDTRMPFWKEVVARIADKPLTGVGFGRDAMRRAYTNMVPKENTLLWHPHNLFLTYGIGMGLPGIAALLFLFGSLAKRFYDLTRSGDASQAVIGTCGLMLLLGVIARNQFNDLFVRDMSLLFWALTGILLGLADRLARPANRQASP